MTTQSHNPDDDLSYYDTELPRVIAAVRRGEKWEYLSFNDGMWHQPLYESINGLKSILVDRCLVRLAPVPVVKWWDRQLDVPPLCWLASTNDINRAYLVVEVSPDGVWTSNGGGNQWWPWNRLRDPDIKHSTDLRNWSDCVKPEGGK